MSKSRHHCPATTTTPRIPLSYIDNKKLAIRSLTRVDTVVYKKKLKREINFSMEIDGEAPTFVSMIDYDYVKQADRSLYRGLNVKLGDFIFAINGKNVSRASKRSVEKMIKSADILVLTLYRQRSGRPGPDTMTRQASNGGLGKSGATKVAKKPGLFPSTLKPFFHKFASSLIGCGGKSSAGNQTQCYEPRCPESKLEMASSVLNENTSDFGYCSIEKALSDKACSGDHTWKYVRESERRVRRPLASDSASYSSGFNSISSSSQSLKKLDEKNEEILSEYDDEETTCDSGFVEEIEAFMANLQQSIGLLVRPTLTFNILTKAQYLDLFQNIEKLIPVTRFLLNILKSQSDPRSESIKIVFDSFITYLNGLPKAIYLFSQLTYHHAKFIAFLEKVMDDNGSLQLFDFLFMPFEFAHKLIKYFQQVVERDADSPKETPNKLIKVLLEDISRSSQAASCELSELLEGSQLSADEESTTFDHAGLPSFDLDASSSVESISSLASSIDGDQWTRQPLAAGTNYSASSPNTSGQRRAAFGRSEAKKKAATTTELDSSSYSSSLSFTMTTISSCSSQA